MIGRTAWRNFSTDSGADAIERAVGSAARATSSWRSPADRPDGRSPSRSSWRTSRATYTRSRCSEPTPTGYAMCGLRTGWLPCGTVDPGRYICRRFRRDSARRFCADTCRLRPARDLMFRSTGTRLSATSKRLRPTTRSSESKASPCRRPAAEARPGGPTAGATPAFRTDGRGALHNTFDRAWSRTIRPRPTAVERVVSREAVLRPHPAPGSRR